MRDISSFENAAWGYYEQNGRHDLPWRQPTEIGEFDPYRIMVSEIMLQQTQVSRVIPKYDQFLQQFPTVQSLAKAPLAEVIKAWSGLGYNRRAKFLHQAASKVVDEWQGVFPQTIVELTALPGIGKNTAGAIAAYAFNRPVTFIETNVRTVLIHHFFADQEAVTDKDLQPILDQAMDDIISQNITGHTPRTWYWALMDYGSFLKQTVGNLSRQSKVYTKQSAFVGSKRQIRGQVLRRLADGPVGYQDIAQEITDQRLEAVLIDLVQEGFITLHAGRYHLGAA